MENDLSRRFGSFRDEISNRLNGVRAEIRRDRKKFIIKLTELCCVSLLTVSAVSYIAYMNCADINLSVYANGEYVGTVSDVQTANLAVLEAESDISNSVQIKSNTPCNITYSLTRKSADDLKIMTKQELVQALYKAQLDDYTAACGLFVDGEFLSAGKDSETVERLINAVQTAVDSGSATLMSELKAENVYVPHTVINAKDELISSLLSSLKYSSDVIDPEIDGDILFSYSQDADKSYAPNINASVNSTIKNDKNDVASEDIEYDKYYESVESSIPYKTVYVETDELEIGTYKLDTEGKEGVTKTLYEIHTVNGTPITKIEVSSTVDSEPVDKVVLKGTKEKPKGITTGVFANPMAGNKFQYTDMYGSRNLNGRYDFHMGVDMWAPVGTPIYAADGGEVVIAGWNGTYGLCVVIRHSNGYETLYAHMSKVAVSEGDMVDKGEHLGGIGDTGKAYGEHLHFEIMIGKDRYNPMEFIPKK